MGGIVSAGLSFLGGESARKDAKKESKRNRAAQERIAADELAESRRRTEVVRERTEPFVKLGAEVQTRLGELTRGPIEESETYKLREKLGLEALNKRLAKQGLTGSGAAIQASSNFYQRLGAEETDFQVGRLQQIGQLGAGLTSATTQGMDTGAYNRLSGAVQQQSNVNQDLLAARTAGQSNLLNAIAQPITNKLAGTKVGQAFQRFGNRLFPQAGGGGAAISTGQIAPFSFLA